MVVLDTNLTDELIQEGYVREVISKIQTMRKDAGFEVTDRIDVRCTCGEKLAAAIASGLEMIKNGTLAVSVEIGEADESYTAQEWKINDQKAVVAIRVSK
jgi:isoleucyl-tRNA synthetase